MRVTCFHGHENQRPPDGFIYPLSLETLNREFGDILLASHCLVKFLTFENTSDVMIINSFWDQAIDLWSMKVIGIKEDVAKAVQDSLNSTGIWEAKRWLLLAHEHLHRRQDEWLIESITLRYEQDKLIWEPLESLRPGKRPPSRPSLPF